MTFEPESSPGRQHMLADQPQIPSAAVEVLTSRWIETVEQVVSISSTPEGREGLKVLLGFEDAAMDSFLGVLRSVLNPGEVERLGDSTPGGPCGALLPPPVEDGEGSA